MSKPLSREFLLSRKKCCQNGCQECPYGYNKNKNMKEKEKYYTPDIEDFKVGYICEILEAVYEEGCFNFNYSTGKYSQGIITSGYNIDIIKDLKLHVRTPYLTKEQLIVEGWVNVIGNFFTKDLSNITKNHGEYFKEGQIVSFNDYELLYNFTDYTLTLRNENREILFDGKCRCINDFRTICKFLNIG